MTVVMSVNGEIETDSFRRSLIETVTWCELTLNKPILSPFRSPELKPEGNIEPAKHSFSTVETVCRRRAEFLKERKVTLLHDVGKEGQLLVYYPSLSLFDGAAELSSDGYFNSNNEPPWDTWVCFGENPASLEPEDYRFFLVCWVPKAFLSIAERGIHVNPEGCIEWLSATAHGIPAKLFRLWSIGRLE
jgi:hypothetical protein